MDLYMYHRMLSPAHPYFPFVFRFSYRHPLSYYHGTYTPSHLE